MTSINIQPSEHATRYVDPEGVPIPNAGQALLGGSSNAPKFGTLIPNRIFVGGIPSNTTEQELKTYFSSFGQVKDVKIISDRLGVSKGSYGFVTFESQEVAEKIIKNESETLIFKDRKLNIGHAIRKQQLFPRPADVPATFFFTGGAIPCGFQGGMPVFPLTGQDYSLLAAHPGSAAAYQQMLMQQANGGALYLSPQASPHAQYPQQQQQHQQQAAAALQSQLAAAAAAAAASAAAAAQPNAAAAFAALQHHQQAAAYQQAAAAAAAAPLTAAGQTSPAAVMAAAAAAVAAASQWSNATSPGASGHQSAPSLQAAPGAPQLTPSQHSPAALGGGFDSQSPQVAALAAAVAAQQQLAAAAWRWPNPAPQQQQQPNGGAGPAPSPVTNGSTSSGSGQSQQQQQQQIRHETHPHQHQQQQQLIFVPSHSAATFAHNVTATSDYSTDYSTHSSGYLEPVEPVSFHCEALMSPQHPPPVGAYAQMYTTTMFDGGFAATSSPGGMHHQMTCPQPLIPPQKLFSANPTTSNNCPGQISHQGSQTPHLYGTPTPQPIILDVFPGGLPLAQMKPGQVLSAENLLGAAQMEHGGVCLNVVKPNGQNRNGGSPKKLSVVNGTSTVSNARAM